MTEAVQDRASRGGHITFADLREMLGFADGEFVSICHQPVGGSFSSSVVKANNACAQVQSLPERSCTWFSINPVEGPERHGRGRGREREVTRWAALYLDCDVKPGAFESQERTWEFINAMSDRIGTAPTVVTHTGHGLQPLWAITDAKLTDENGEFAEVAWSRAYRVTRRFDRLAAKVALESFGAKLDKVADLSRVLRVPDTTNWKNPHEPVPTYAVLGTGGPLADMDAIEEFLDQWSAVEVESDQPVGGEVLSAPEGWQFGEYTCPYVVTMVTAWNQESDRPRGGRHQWAMNRAVRLACAHRLGCVNEAGLITSLQYLEASLAYWCQIVGVRRSLHPNEIGGAYRWAVYKVSTFDDQRTRKELGDHKHQKDAAQNAMEDPDGAHAAPGFWAQRDVLSHIHRYARHYGAAPEPVLGKVLRRAISHVPPNVVLPPTVGDIASVNLFTVNVGRSGQGKDIANGVGGRAVRFISPDGGALEDPESPGIGSGEGLARLFKGYGNGTEARTTVNLEVNEVGTLESLIDRKGQTLIYELLKGYMGQALGFSNAQRATTTHVGAHSYRLCLGVGAQPENAEFFLRHEKTGFPQRFLWLPTDDPDAPRPSREQSRVVVESTEVTIPTFRPVIGDTYYIAVPDSVTYQIRDFRWQVLTGSKDVDPLDGHLMLTRLKVAFGLALLEGRPDITEDDWRIAGGLLDVSSRVRTRVQAVIRESQREKNTARAHAQADREEVVAERLADHRQKRVWGAVVRKLKRDKRVSRPELYKACDSSIRDDFDLVLGLLIQEEVIVCCEGGDDYELAPE
jgi:hypothetical protein